MTHDEEHDAMQFALALNKAMLVLRYVAGSSPVCAACFCAAVAEHVKEIGEGIEHGTHLERLDIEEFRREWQSHGEDDIGPVMGSA